MIDVKDQRKSKNVQDLRKYRTGMDIYDAWTYIPPNGLDKEDIHKRMSIIALQEVKKFSDEYAEGVLRNHYRNKYPKDFRKLMDYNWWTDKTPHQDDYLYEKYKKKK